MLKTAHLLRTQKVSGLEPSQDRAEVFEQFRRLAILDRSRVHEIQHYLGGSDMELFGTSPSSNERPTSPSQ